MVPISCNKWLYISSYLFFHDKPLRYFGFLWSQIYNLFLETNATSQKLQFHSPRVDMWCLSGPMIIQRLGRKENRGDGKKQARLMQPFYGMWLRWKLLKIQKPFFHQPKIYSQNIFSRGTISLRSRVNIAIHLWLETSDNMMFNYFGSNHNFFISVLKKCISSREPEPSRTTGILFHSKQ